MPLRPQKYYLTGSTFPASNHLRGVDSSSISLLPPNTNSTTIWTVAKVASQSYWEMTGSTTMTVVAATGIKPNGTPDATKGDAWVIGPLLGTFNTGVWTVQLGVVAGTAASRGQFDLRLLKGTDLSGSGALGFSTGQVWGTTIAVPNTTSASFCTASFNLTSSLQFFNEYLFVQAAWAITTAAGSNGSTITFIQGSGSFITMSSFEDNTVVMWDHDDFPAYSSTP